MKLLLFFLFSIAASAQTYNADTIIYKNNNVLAGKITDISNSRLQIDYSSDRTREEYIQQLKKVIIGKLGIVYYSGFTVDVDKINNYLANRTEEINIQRPADDKIFSQAKARVNHYDTIYAEQEKKIQGINQERRWSFGVLLIPYYSGKIYGISQYYQDYPYPAYSTVSQYLITSSLNQLNMEAQLSFALTDQLHLTFDGTYTSTYYENRSESHQANTDGSYTYNSGNLDKNDLTLLDFSLGVKYYLQKLIAERVSVYFLAGMGKQFASAEETNQNLFQQPGTALTKDNKNEYIEDANSPFHFNLGFGAEYLFNESLSLTSNIRFIYSKISAKYDSRQISDYQTSTSTTDYKSSDFITRIGIGLNFYF
ncbi:MAG: outer membrane beta-barrel protein [Ignavibacteriaceae bacterium]